MKSGIFLQSLLLFGLLSCGGGGGSSSSTLTALKNFRSSLGQISNIAPMNDSKFLVPGDDIGSDWTGTNGYSYPDEGIDLSIQEWFGHELDITRPLGGSGNNFFNRLDVGLMLLCAIFQDLGSDLPPQTTIMTATAASINANCGTLLAEENVTLQGQVATVTAVTNGAYEKKVEIDDMTIFVTNNDSLIKIAYGLDEGVVGDRIIFSMNKITGDFQLEFMQYEGDGTIYRAFKKDQRVHILGLSPQGSGAKYFATLYQNKAALDFSIAGGATKSICINLINGSQDSAPYGTCFSPAPEEDLSDFSGILTYNLNGNISTWADVDENTEINFSTPADLNNTTFSLDEGY